MKPNKAGWLTRVFRRVADADLKARFAALTLSAGMAIGGAGCVHPRPNFEPMPERGNKIQINVGDDLASAPGRYNGIKSHMGGEDPQQVLISMRQAVMLAQQPDTGALSPEREKLVRLVHAALKTPLGRAMLDNAVKNDIWLTIDNDTTGGGYYTTRYDLIAIELKDSGAGDDFAYDRSSDAVFDRWFESYLGILFHELGHMYQDKVWDNFSPPRGTCSFDYKLWNLCQESQADLIEDEGLRQYNVALGRQKDVPFSLATLYSRFVNDVLYGSAFHRGYYEFDKGRLDDGKHISADRFIKAFGGFPGQMENFLEGKFDTVDDIYRTFVFPDPQMKAWYEAARRKAGERTVETRREHVITPFSFSFSFGA